MSDDRRTAQGREDLRDETPTGIRAHRLTWWHRIAVLVLLCGFAVQVVASARQKREIARGRFELGLANNLDITNADEELIRAESLLLTALVDHATNVARLEASIGGSL